MLNLGQKFSSRSKIMDNSSETSLHLMFPELPQIHLMLNHLEDLSSKSESCNIDFMDTFSANKPRWPGL